MQENRMFGQMMLASRRRLEGRAPAEIADRAGIGFDAGISAFHLQSLGKTYTLSHPGYAFMPEMNGWHALLALHYLDLADGAGLANRLISFSQLKDGMVRGGGFDRRCEEALQALMGRIEEKELQERCIAMGGSRIESNADFTAVLPFFPQFPVTLKIWFADEDFPASGRMMLDASADHYLTVEDAVTVGELILERLAGKGNG